MIEVSGEIYFPRSAFERLNADRAEAGLPAFANPRNAAAGTIRQQDPALAAERPLQIWSLRDRCRHGVDHATHSDELDPAERATASGSTTRSPSTTPAPRWSPAASGGSRSGEGLDYEIDGAVGEVDDRAPVAPARRRRARAALRDRLEVPADDGDDDAQAIVWNVGRTGHLVPFAMLEPTHLSG